MAYKDKSEARKFVSEVEEYAYKKKRGLRCIIFLFIKNQNCKSTKASLTEF